MPRFVFTGLKAYLTFNYENLSFDVKISGADSKIAGDGNHLIFGHNI